MLKAFQKHIGEQQLFDSEATLLLAISGGVDSVVLAHLLKAGGYKLTLAHANFKLRGKESDADEAFCRKLADTLDLRLYTRSFNVAAFVKKSGQSIQMAARQLRYDWFSQLLAENGFNHLVTAHHAGDAIETLFINLLRGTGIKGIKGIPEKSGQLVRPLLPFTKTELLAYATKNKIAYRTDKSNVESKYERNFLRLKVIPLLKELQPQLESIMLVNLANFREEAGILEEAINGKLKGIVEKKNSWTYLDKQLLEKEKYRKTLLHFALAPMGFNISQVAAVDRHISAQGLAGKLISSPTHTLTIDRQHLVIREKSTPVSENRQIQTLKALEKVPYLRLSFLKEFSIPAADELILEPSRLVFPITIRSKMRGDRFKPFGMKGFKLLSDFLKDQKLNNFEKESCKLLVNGNGDIIWVMGLRSDERYRVKTAPAPLVKLKLIG